MTLVTVLPWGIGIEPDFSDTLIFSNDLSPVRIREWMEKYVMAILRHRNSSGRIFKGIWSECGQRFSTRLLLFSGSTCSGQALRGVHNKPWHLFINIHNKPTQFVLDQNWFILVNSKQRRTTNKRVLVFSMSELATTIDHCPAGLNLLPSDRGHCSNAA